VVFDTWLDMPVWGILLSLAAVFCTTATAIYGIAFSARTRPYAQGWTGVVAPFFGSVAILFALLPGFLANEVWERDRQATRSVLAERDGVLALQALSAATAADRQGIRESARDYIRILVEDEWPRMRDQESSQKAELAQLDLLTRASALQISTEAGPVVHRALLDTVLRLQTARYDRLAVSGDRTDRTKWAAVLILGLITQMALGLVHLEKPRAQIAALSIFSAAAVITLGLIAARERPFDGPLRQSSFPLEEALTIMAPEPKS
jgi:heme A synthase